MVRRVARSRQFRHRRVRTGTSCVQLGVTERKREREMGRGGE